MNKKCIFMVTCGLLPLLVLCACSSPKFPYGTYDWTEGVHSGVETFNPDGTFVSTMSGGMIWTKGNFAVKGNTLTFLTDMQCFPQGKNAAYIWRYSNETLVFKDTGNDTCTDRMNTLDSTQYHLQK
jgi:hypothetical protein